MRKRVMTAIVFAVVLIAALLVGGWIERLVLLACMGIGVWEMCRALEAGGYKPVRWPGLVYCALTALLTGLGAMGLHPFDRVNDGLLALAAGVVLGFSVVVLSGEPDFDRAFSTCFPMLYPGLLFSLLIQLMDRGNGFISALAMALALFTASINDVFALFGGARFGRHKLSPKISPKKTIEGAVSGLIASVVFAAIVPMGFLLVGRRLLQLPEEMTALPPIWAFALMGLIAGALSQIGDLAASIVKRWCGIKDFGNMFPGHGGMMDRFDGILFCSFAWWIFFQGFGL